jgi:hypothetical protein
MTFVQRYTAPLFSWIPDVSEIPPGRLIAIGVGISLLLHLLAFLIIALCGLFNSPKIDFASAGAKPREIELEVVPPDPTPPPFSIIPTQQRLFMDSRGLDIATEAADKPLFESDENMRAASETPATGELPLPGQHGRERPFNGFQNQRSLLGPVAQPFTPDTPPTPATPPTPPPTPQIAQQTPPAATQEPAAPPPAPQKADKTEKTEKADDKPPTPTQEKTKPTALRAVDKPRDDEIPLTKKLSIPEAVTEILKPVATPSSVAHAAVLRPLDEQVAKLTTPAPRPQPRHESGYQPEQEQNHIESSISNRGKSAVDSIATPMAKYRKQVNDAIGSRWYYYIRDKMDLIAFGSVRISFVIDAQGHISATKVDSNTSNQSLADVSLRAVHDAEIAPPPRDPASPTSQEPLEWTLTFTYYPFSQ